MGHEKSHRIQLISRLLLSGVPERVDRDIGYIQNFFHSRGTSGLSEEGHSGGASGDATGEG